MARHTTRHGLDLPLAGSPEQSIDAARQVTRVAVMADDFVGMKPTMHVREGESVRIGQLLFEDKKTPGVRHSSPGAGKVVAVHRGERRALESVVIELSSADIGGRGDAVRFSSFTNKHPGSLGRDQVRDLLVESGAWVALRRRPFSRVPDPQGQPEALFITVTDSHPQAPDPAVVLADRGADFERGVAALAKLTSGPVFVCTRPGLQPPLPSSESIRVEEFDGPHPAGTAGYQIHTLHPAGRQHEVWWVDYPEVIAIGKLFATGELDVERVVSLAGPSVRRPRLLRTRVGAWLDEVVRGELAEGDHRVISGSVLTGRQAQGPELGYLGRRHRQVSVLPEGRKRELLGWLAPGLSSFSVTSAYLSKLVPGKRFAMDTSTNGSPRAIVPIGVYEKVFPFDIPPTALLRALAMQDIEQAERLGVLELDEEDLGTCSFVCPGKHEYGLYLRNLLTTIEKEG
ncbi:MAG: Na(+)-translocating NADH-quinone reductase subunit A [Thermoanaerobaculia bacterium]